MTPLGRTTVGLWLALADFRVGGVDVLPDVLGLLLVATGLGALARRHPRFATSARVAVVAAVLSLADLVHPQRTVVEGDERFSSSTTSAVPPDGLQGVLVAGYLAASAVLLVLLSLALRDALREHGDDDGAARFGRFAVLHLTLGVLALTAAVAGLLLGVDGAITPDGLAAALVLLVVLAGLAVQVWFLVSLAGVRARPELQEHAPAS